MTVLAGKQWRSTGSMQPYSLELTEIYSTPTPKGWPEPKKVNNLYIGLIAVLLQYPGPDIYTRDLHMTHI